MGGGLRRVWAGSSRADRRRGHSVALLARDREDRDNVCVGAWVLALGVWQGGVGKGMTYVWV